VNTRLDLLERSRAETAAALTLATNRFQALETKAAQYEATMANATRIRDQQMQGLQDQVRGLSTADQAGSERIAALANTIAGILPRLEEILRRQERLENRLSAPLPRSNADEPSVAWVPDRDA
jgi:prefoldin subunit 5